jgi:membrane protein DedA with SNARE-associated domain
MSYWRFIFWDGLAALGSAPIFVYLGFKFGGELDLLGRKLKEGQVAVLVTLAALAIAYGVYRHRKNRALRRRMGTTQGSSTGREMRTGSKADEPWAA